MKKTVGFILTLIFVVMLSSVVTVHAETYLIGIKDYAEQNVKKKPKKVKKNKKNKKSKKVKNSKKKNIGTIKVVSASSLYTKRIDDLSKVDYQKAVISVLRPTNGYIKRLPFFDKFAQEEKGNSGVLDILYGENTTGFVEYCFLGYKFQFIDSGNLSSVSLGYDISSVTLDADKALLEKKFLAAGLDIKFSKEVLLDIIENDKKYNITIGDADWVISCDGVWFTLNRVIRPVSVSYRDTFKAATFGRLNITSDFYDQFLTFLNTTDLLNEEKGSLIGLNFRNGGLMHETNLGDGIIKGVLFNDQRDPDLSEIVINGYLNPETAVTDLTRILKNYYGIDFNDFDTSRVNKIVENDVVNWDPVDYVKYYGENEISFGVMYAREKGYAFSIKVTVHNKK